MLDWLGGIVAPIDGDRPFGEDIERLITAGTYAAEHQCSFWNAG